ncbi:MAG: PEGA domain-containing protein [Candidatus Eisenbacteria bacterium]|nr:PEGA domain-containing protein [Candidatus Eisenbacteria bacterium]
MTIDRRRFLGAVPILLMIALRANAAADPLTIWTHPLGARIELKGSMVLRGESPLPLRADHTGAYRARVEMPGYETAVGSLLFRVEDGALRLDRHDRSPGADRLVHSLFLPGSGQIRDGRRTEGIFWGGATLAAGIAAIVTESRYRGAREDFNDADAALERTDPNDRAAYLDQLHETFRLEAETNGNKRARDYSLGTLGAFWALGAADAFLFRSSFDVREGDPGTVQIGLVRKTRLRRALRSLLYPGMGQNYSGRNIRALAFAGAATAAGVSALVSHVRYKEEVDLLDALGRERAELIPGGPEEAALLLEVDRETTAARNRRDDHRDGRNLAAVITAGIWIGAVLDAALIGPDSPGEEAPHWEISFLDPPVRGSTAIGIRGRF